MNALSNLNPNDKRDILRFINDNEGADWNVLAQEITRLSFPCEGKDVSDFFMDSLLGI